MRSPRRGARVPRPLRICFWPADSDAALYRDEWQRRRQGRRTYPHESDDCNLADLAAKWGVTTVRCIVLVKDSIRIADEIANVSKGCEGIVHLRQTGIS